MFSVWKDTSVILCPDTRESWVERVITKFGDESLSCLTEQLPKLERPSWMADEINDNELCLALVAFQNAVLANDFEPFLWIFLLSILERCSSLRGLRAYLEQILYDRLCSPDEPNDLWCTKYNALVCIDHTTESHFGIEEDALWSPALKGSDASAAHMV